MKLSIFIIICMAVALACPSVAVSVSARETGCDYAECQTDPVESLLEPCGLTVDKLQAGLHHELVQYADDFLQAESNTGVNAVFLCAVAGLESGWGRYCANDNNLFGWTDGSGYMAFDSPEDCIFYVATAIKENYLLPDGCYFEGYTVEDVNVHYNGREFWEQKVNKIMDDIYAASSEAAFLF